jgi:uncharacterized membrane protein
MTWKPGATSQAPSRSPRALMVLRLLLVCTTLISVYMAWMLISRGGAPAGCGPDSGCDAVIRSRWGYWLGVPVTLPGLMVYSVMLAASFAVKPSRRLETRLLAWKIMLISAVAISGAAVWFTLLQLLVIQRICYFCIAAHACGLVSSGIALRLAPLRTPLETKRERKAESAFPPHLIWKTIGLGAALVVLLAAGQTLHEEKRFVVRESGGGAGAVTRSSSSRIFSVHDGAFQFDLHEIPLTGSPLSNNVIVSLFDYTCANCRTMHGHLMEAHRKLGERVAIVSLPSPLEKLCNPYLPRTDLSHLGACEYARLGLAVWRSDRTKYGRFEDWLFSPAKPPLLGEAKRFAASLVGSESLEKALADPWISQQIDRNISLLLANTMKVGYFRMPQLIVGQRITSGPLRSVRDLYEILGVHP